MVSRLDSRDMILIVAGVSGSGKTTVGTLLASRLNWPFADADDLHPAASIEKMRALMIFLTPDREVLTRRLAARHGHFFPGQLLGSQFDALEPPGPDERVISIVPGDDPASTVASIVAVLWPGEEARMGAAGADARAGTLDTAGGDHEAET